MVSNEGKMEKSFLNFKVRGLTSISNASSVFAAR